jgi:membrane protease YdiL (CAAX protease family)
VLTDALKQHLPVRWADGMQALVFMLFHEQWQFWPTLFAIAIIAGRLRRRTGSLVPSMALHASWNAFIVAIRTAASARA